MITTTELKSLRNFRKEAGCGVCVCLCVCVWGGWKVGRNLVMLYVYPNPLFLGSHKFDLYRSQRNLTSISLTFTIFN